MRNKLFYSISLLLFFVINVEVSNAQWQPTNGPYEFFPNIESFAVEGTNLFAGSSGGIFLSTNGGVTWTHMATELQVPNVRALAVIGKNIFAGSSGGVFLSTNNGSSWTPVNNGITNKSIGALVVIGTNLFAGSTGGIFLSTNNGTSWVPVNTGINYEGADSVVYSLAVNGTNLFAGYANNVYLTNNNGNTWTLLNTGITSTILSLAASGTNVFAGTISGGIFLSTNNGITWDTANTGLPYFPSAYTYPPVTCFLIQGTNIFAGTAGQYSQGLFLSTNNGNSWTEVNNGLSNGVLSLIDLGANIFAGTGSPAAGGTGSGVFMSTNNGGDWTAMNRGFSNSQVETFAIAGSNIFAGTGIGGIFLSTDNANSWTEKYYSNDEIYASVVKGTNIFVGHLNGILLSNNNGSTWTVMDSGLTNHTVAALAVSGTNIYAGTAGGGVFTSANNGVSWNTVNNGLTGLGLNVNSFAIAGTKLFAGTSGGIFLSTNNGNNWMPINNGIRGNGLDILSLAISGTNLFAGTDAGLFLSTNNGTSWIPVDSGINFINNVGNSTEIDSAVYTFAVSGTNIFVGTASGVYLSINNGKSWTAVNTGFHNNPSIVLSLTIFGTNIFAGIDLGGVWVRPLSEMINLSVVSPQLFLNKSSLTQGQSVNITGNNFSVSSQAKILINGPAGYSQIISPVATDAQGNFTYSFATTNAMPLGNYGVSATDSLTNKTTITEVFRLNAVVTTSWLQIVYPVTAATFNVNQSFEVEWKDKLFEDAAYPIIGSQRSYQYTLEYSDNGGAWQPLTTVQGHDYIDTYEHFLQHVTIANASSNLRIRVTDFYNNSRFAITPSLIIQTAAASNIQVSYNWDYSYTPAPSVPVIGVAADGTGRFYMNVSKINPASGANISSVSVVLSDAFNGTDYTKLGKVAVATQTSSYSSEANGLTTVSATNTSSNLNNYYFWYVAPDDFTGNDPNDSLATNRTVTATFTVHYQGGGTDIVQKIIKIVRPPLMLVHGLGGSPNTWDNFANTAFGSTTNFINDSRFTVSQAISMDPTASFASNALNMTFGASALDLNTFQGLINKIRQFGYASNRVDYVCHSMGGCVLRTAMQQYSNDFTRTGTAASRNFKNYENGYVNKVIMLDVPNNGSPWADILNRYVSELPCFARTAIQVWWGLSSQETILPLMFIEPVDVNGGSYCTTYIPPFLQYVYDFKTNDAVNDLQINGGVNFASTNAQTHLIAGDFFPGTQTSLTPQIPQQVIDFVNSVGNDYLQKFLKYLLDIALNKEANNPQLLANLQLAISQVDPVQQVLDFLNYMSIAMDAYNVVTFLPESDLIVGVSSETAGQSKYGAPNVTTFDNYVGHAVIRPVTTNIDVGNEVNYLLNSSINSSLFGTIPATSYRMMSPAHSTSTTIAPLNNNPIVSYKDSTKIMMLYPNDSVPSIVDSTLHVLVNVSDTSHLVNMDIEFQNKTYYIDSVKPGVIDVTVQVNANMIDTQLVSVEAFYNYPDSGVFIYDGATVNVVHSDTLLQFGTTPDILFLVIGQHRNPGYYAIYQQSGTTTVNFSQYISINVANPSIVKFDSLTKSFVGVANGETNAIISYKGFADTLYFVVGGCPQSAHFNVTQNENTFTAPAASYYYWSTGDSSQSIIATDTGYYYVTIVDSSGCSSTSNSVHYSGPVTVIENHVSALNFTLFPNPANNEVNLTSQLAHADHYVITVSDITGRQLFLTQGESSGSLQQDIDVSKLASGIYFIGLRVSDGNVVRKFMKE